MIYTIEEAQKALNVISSVCSEYKGECFGCPYSTEYKICGIVGSIRDVGEYKKAPMYWKIVNEISLFRKDEEN